MCEQEDGHGFTVFSPAILTDHGGTMRYRAETSLCALRALAYALSDVGSVHAHGTRPERGVYGHFLPAVVLRD